MMRNSSSAHIPLRGDGSIDKAKTKFLEELMRVAGARHPVTGLRIEAWHHFRSRSSKGKAVQAANRLLARARLR